MRHKSTPTLQPAKQHIPMVELLEDRRLWSATLLADLALLGAPVLPPPPPAIAATIDMSVVSSLGSATASADFAAPPPVLAGDAAIVSSDLGVLQLDTSISAEVALEVGPLPSDLAQAAAPILDETADLNADVQVGVSAGDANLSGEITAAADLGGDLVLDVTAAVDLSSGAELGVQATAGTNPGVELGASRGDTTSVSVAIGAAADLSSLDVAIGVDLDSGAELVVYATAGLTTEGGAGLSVGIDTEAGVSDGVGLGAEADVEVNSDSGASGGGIDLSLGIGGDADLGAGGLDLGAGVDLNSSSGPNVETRIGLDADVPSVGAVPAAGGDAGTGWNQTGSDGPDPLDHAVNDAGDPAPADMKGFDELTSESEVKSAQADEALAPADGLLEEKGEAAEPAGVGEESLLGDPSPENAGLVTDYAASEALSLEQLLRQLLDWLDDLAHDMGATWLGISLWVFMALTAAALAGEIARQNLRRPRRRLLLGLGNVPTG